MSFFSGFDLSAGLQQLQQVRRLMWVLARSGGNTNVLLHLGLVECRSQPCRSAPALLQVGDRFSALKDELERNIEDSIRAERFGGLAGDGEGQAAGTPSAAAAGEGWGGSDIGSPLALRLEDAPSAAEQAADVAADGAQAGAPQQGVDSPAAASPAGTEQQAAPAAAGTPTKQQPVSQQQVSAPAAAPQGEPADDGVEQGPGGATASPGAPPSPPSDAAPTGPAPGADAEDSLVAAGSPAPATDAAAAAAGGAAGEAAAVTIAASPAASPKWAEQPQAGTPAHSPTAASPPRAAAALDQAAVVPPPAAPEQAAGAASTGAAGAAAPKAAVVGDEGLDERGLRALVLQLREALAAREQQIERKAEVRGCLGVWLACFPG